MSGCTCVSVLTWSCHCGIFSRFDWGITQGWARQLSSKIGDPNFCLTYKMEPSACSTERCEIWPNERNGVYITYVSYEPSFNHHMNHLIWTIRAFEVLCCPQVWLSLKPSLPCPWLLPWYHNKHFASEWQLRLSLYRQLNLLNQEVFRYFLVFIKDGPFDALGTFYSLLKIHLWRNGPASFLKIKSSNSVTI